jgi:phosphatidylinositol alpha-1,6-mannosyltransferase
VLVVTNDFPPRRGGIESFVHSLCRGLDPDEVVVYTASMPAAESFDARLPFPVVRDPRSLLVPTPAVGRRVRAAWRDFGCDRVVFGASAPLGLLARDLRAAGAQRIVALTHGHEVWWSRVPGTRSLMRRIAGDVDVLTYVSEFCRAAIVTALRPEDADRFVGLPPGVDGEVFGPDAAEPSVRASWGVDPGQVVVLSAARLVRRKGHDRLIDAWSLVHREHPSAVLVIVGDGPQREALRCRLDRHGVGDSVRLVPAVEWEAMPSLYRAADVFALVCRTRRRGFEPEAFGIVVVEAAASGLPVVVGRSGGAPETLDDGLTGHLVDPTDPGEIADRLSGLIANAGLRRELGRRGRDRVIRRFGLGATQARFRDLLFGSAGAWRPATQNEHACDAGDDENSHHHRQDLLQQGEVVAGLVDGDRAGRVAGAGTELLPSGEAEAAEHERDTQCRDDLGRQRDRHA